MKKPKKTRGKHGKKDNKKEEPIPSDDEVQLENQQILLQEDSSSLGQA
jgi:hypothetical protein